MNREEIRQKIAAILTEDFNVPSERITDDATFRGAFALDSLDIVDFILLLQKDFGFKAPSESYQDLQNVGMLVEFVAQKLAARAA
jgi:acyl carrier protein